MCIGKIARGINSPTAANIDQFFTQRPVVCFGIALMRWVRAFQVHAAFVVADLGEEIAFLGREFQGAEARVGGERGEFFDLGFDGLGAGAGFLDQGGDNTFNGGM